MFKDFFWSANSPCLPTWCRSRWTIQFCLPSVSHWSSSTLMKPVRQSCTYAYMNDLLRGVATREQTLFRGMCTVKLHQTTVLCTWMWGKQATSAHTHTKHTLWCTATEPAATQLRPPDDLLSDIDRYQTVASGFKVNSKKHVRVQ